MSLVPCPQCGNLVSTDATVCPICGLLPPRWAFLVNWGRGVQTGGILMLLIGTVGLVAGMDMDDVPLWIGGGIGLFVLGSIGMWWRKR
jgi:hypothetical protein